jgi:hypothetical protein
VAPVPLSLARGRKASPANETTTSTPGRPAPPPSPTRPSEATDSVVARARQAVSVGTGALIGSLPLAGSDAARARHVPAAVNRADGGRSPGGPTVGSDATGGDGGGARPGWPRRAAGCH